MAENRMLTKFIIHLDKTSLIKSEYRSKVTDGFFYLINFNGDIIMAVNVDKIRYIEMEYKE